MSQCFCHHIPVSPIRGAKLSGRLVNVHQSLFCLLTDFCAFQIFLQNELNFEPSILVKTLSSALATLAHFAKHKEQVNESGGGLSLRHQKNGIRKADRVRLW